MTALSGLHNSLDQTKDFHMNRFFFRVLVAIVCICGCQRKPVDPPKPVVTVGPQAQEKVTPKPPEPFTNSIGMKFVWIPPGTFMMGSPKGEEKQGYDESQHKVTLTRGFYMGVYTVTQEQWQEVMGNNPSEFKGEKNLPVEKVSWAAPPPSP